MHNWNNVQVLRVSPLTFSVQIDPSRSIILTRWDAAANSDKGISDVVTLYCDDSNMQAKSLILRKYICNYALHSSSCYSLIVKEATDPW